MINVVSYKVVHKVISTADTTLPSGRAGPPILFAPTIKGQPTHKQAEWKPGCQAPATLQTPGERHNAESGCMPQALLEKTTHADPTRQTPALDAADAGMKKSELAEHQGSVLRQQPA
jgi:hypothetical protein